MSFKSNAVTSLLGVDTGGTFTDFFYLHIDQNGRQIKSHKVLSTPVEPERAILQGIKEMQIPLEGLQLIHGSTVATNAVLESKGVETVYITNRGLKDVLTIGRQARTELYNLRPIKPKPPVPSRNCLETGGRFSAKGDVLETLSNSDINKLLEQIARIKPKAVAINLLFSFLDGRFEQQIAESLPNELFVSCSHQIMPEYREYERGMTTWLNSYVGPLVQGYLHRLERQSQPARVSVMRSSGQSCGVIQAGKEAVNLLLSGPAGGLNAARYIAAAVGESRVLTFDMGGTSTDVAMIDGEIILSNQSSIAGYPVGVPMVDMHTIGAGGGSIARVDAARGLHVGPESAGANPGPACYAQGGVLPTVTDANLVLGRLPVQQKLAGEMSLQLELARQAVARLQAPLAIEQLEVVAEGIIAMANESMSKALKVISVERGIDPRDFSLMAFGGAGGMHVCSLADSLEMRQAIVPAQSGVLSALGMLVAPVGRVISKTIAQGLDEVDEIGLKSAFTAMQQQGTQLLHMDGYLQKEIIAEWSLDLCYHGQSSTLNLSWRPIEELQSAFHQLHKERYGHQLERAVQIVNLRVLLQCEQSIDVLENLDYEQSAPVMVNVYGETKKIPVYLRNALKPELIYYGPIIVVDTLSTVYIDAGWSCLRHQTNSLLLTKDSEIT